MEPRIHYVTSRDGTRIAVSTLGHGRPFVIVPSMWLTTTEMYWRLPESRANLERLAERRKVVQYDTRGYGLSEREVTDFSFEARLGDLTAVVASLEAPEVDLMVQSYGGPTAIRYAAEHPDRVGCLILSNSFARGRDLIFTPKQRALRHLLEVDWELYLQTQSLVTSGWTETGLAVANSLMGAVTSDAFLASMRAARDDDVTDILADVRCPTLVIQRRTDPNVSTNSWRLLAAAIPNARLALVDEVTPVILASDARMRTIEAFLDEGTQSTTPEPLLPSGTTIILFADIVDSTSLTERLGDTAFRDKARDLDAALRTIIRERSGTPIEGKLLGDGVLATFSSAAQAIEAALTCGRSGQDVGLPLHLGLHAGDVIREADNVYGGAVNIAARIAAASTPGEVLVSDTVRSLARTSAGVTFEDRGEQSLKGIDDPVRAFAVIQREQ